MARLAVLASGSGSNFEAIAEKISGSEHEICCLVCDKKDAYVFKRAERFGIKSHFVSYPGRKREDTEKEITEILEAAGTDLVALAGFMRLLTPQLIDHFPRKIINIHPSLLPKYPGKHGILDSYNSEDTELGITIHRVDYGLDTGPIIMQKSFKRCGKESIEEIESMIHQLEHQSYPDVLLEILGEIDNFPDSYN